MSQCYIFSPPHPPQCDMWHIYCATYHHPLAIALVWHICYRWCDILIMRGQQSHQYTNIKCDIFDKSLTHHHHPPVVAVWHIGSINPLLCPWPLFASYRSVISTERTVLSSNWVLNSVVCSHRTSMTRTVGSSVINSCSHVLTSAAVLDTQWHRIHQHYVLIFIILLWSFPCLSCV